jgi:hypothetical protein
LYIEGRQKPAALIVGVRKAAALSKLANPSRNQRGSAPCCYEFNIGTNGTSSLAPLGERGDRKAVGEGVLTKLETICQNRKSRPRGKNEKTYVSELC